MSNKIISKLYRTKCRFIFFLEVLVDSKLSAHFQCLLLFTLMLLKEVEAEEELSAVRNEERESILQTQPKLVLFCHFKKWMSVCRNKPSADF